MISRKKDLSSYITLRDDEEEFFSNPLSSALEFGISKDIANLLSSDAIRLQFIPRLCELKNPSSRLDPLMEMECEKSTPRLIHRYKKRVALLVTDNCFSYCRHCFRRRWTGHRAGGISESELKSACLYISSHPELSEILITGGDPLTLSNSELEAVFSAVRLSIENIIIRLCTRALLSNPKRFDDGLLSLICRYNREYPVFLMLQFNHPDEIGEHNREVIKRLRQSGVLMFNQTVLLKGVNDDARVLCALSEKLLSNYIKPYYVFLLDKVSGIEHFGVGINRAMEIEKQMRSELSGLAMPQFAIDLPQSGGKIPVHYNYIKTLREDGQPSVFVSPDGNIREY